MNYKLILFLFLIPFIAYSQDVWVEGYYKRNGNYVEGHYRSRPNNTNSDNYSTEGNINPYTDEEGIVKTDNGVPYQDVDYDENHDESNYEVSEFKNYRTNDSPTQANFYSSKSQNLSDDNNSNYINNKRVIRNQPITFGYIIGNVLAFIVFILILYLLILGVFEMFK